MERKHSRRLQLEDSRAAEEEVVMLPLGVAGDDAALALGVEGGAKVLEHADLLCTLWASGSGSSGSGSHRPPESGAACPKK
jgi:hypothetical protein